MNLTFEGQGAEQFWKEVSNELDDDTLDNIGVSRAIEKTSKLVHEPVSIAITLALTPPVLVAVVAAVRKVLEERIRRDGERALASAEVNRQKALLTFVADAPLSKTKELAALVESFPAVFRGPRK